MDEKQTEKYAEYKFSNLDDQKIDPVYGKVESSHLPKQSQIQEWLSKNKMIVVTLIGVTVGIIEGKWKLIKPTHYSVNEIQSIEPEPMSVEAHKAKNVNGVKYETLIKTQLHMILI